MKYATFFGGAINDTTTKEYQDSILIGNLLASKGYIVKNGGYRGLMEAVSKGTSEAGGKVIGYTCATFGFTQGNNYLTETNISTDIYDRLRDLISSSEIFIIQRGGVGTLAEFFLLLDEMRKMNIKPEVFIFGEEWYKLITSMGDFITPQQLINLKFCKDFNDFKEIFK